MAVKTLKTSPSGGIVIPTSSDTYAKIEITDDDDVTYTVLDSYGGAVEDNYTMSATVKKVATSNLGSFRLRLANVEGKWLNKFDGGEVVKVYADSVDATTLIFYGKIDNIKYGVDVSNGFYVDLDGRDYPELRDKTITGTKVAATIGESIASILYNFYNDITLQFWNGSEWSTATYEEISGTVSWSHVTDSIPATLINMTYQHKKGWAVLTEMCDRVGVDCYIDWVSGTGYVLRMLVKDAITNTGSNISYGINLISLSGFGINNMDIYNRITVYGKTESDNILLLKTEDDTTSQSNLWIKDKIVTAQDLDTMDDVQDKADYELELGTDINANGNISSICLPTLRPGDNVNVSIPYCNIDGTYRVQSYSHVFDTNSVFKTNIQLVRKDVSVSDLLVVKVNAEEFVGAISNGNAMRNSYTIYFTESPEIVSLVNTVIDNGILSLSSGVVTGTMTSNILTTDSDVTSCELRKYENYSTSQDTYQVTNDSGLTWEDLDITEGNVHIFSSTGSQLGFRVTMNRTDSGDPSPAYESFSLLYK